MTIPLPTTPEIRISIARPTLVAYLADTDGEPLVDSDGSRFAIGPAVDLPLDLTDRVLSAALDLGDVQAVGSSHAGVDAPVQVLSLSLDAGDPSLIPGAQSRLNVPDDAIRTYRRIDVWALADSGDDAVHLFAGYLGDEVRSIMSASRTTLTVRARDLAKPLQDMFIADWPIIASTATPETPVSVADVIEEMLALVPEQRRPAFQATTTTFVVRHPYRPQNQSVWDAVQQVTMQAGGVARFIGETLHFVLPPRPRQLDLPAPREFRFTPDDVFIDDLGRTDTDIRNVVTVAYQDRETGERRTVEARDEWSVDNITGGIEKASIIEVDATSQIDTDGEAQVLAERFISDMSREFASSQITMPFRPSLQLFDVIEISNPRVGYAPRRFAVHSLRHAWDGFTYRTVAAGVSQVVGRRRSWLDLEPRAGSPNNPRGPHQTVLPIPTFALYRNTPGFTVEIADTATGAAEYEVYWSTTNGFTPGGATLRARGAQTRWQFTNMLDSSAPDLVTEDEHHVRVRSIDERGNASPYSAQKSILPGSLLVGPIEEGEGITT